MNHLRKINAADFESEVLRASGPVVVDFYAPWCGPCKMLAPVLDQFAGELAGQVKIVKLNVDNAQELAGQYDITGVPTLKLFRDGKAVGEVVGMPSPGALEGTDTSREINPARVNPIAIGAGRIFGSRTHCLAASSAASPDKQATPSRPWRLGRRLGSA